MRNMIATTHAPQAIGPYSQAVTIQQPGGTWIFCSGQIPLDPVTQQMVGAGDVRLQTEQVLKNLAAVLTAADASLSDVVRTTIYLTDLAEFAAVNEVYGRFFSAAPPARATVQVAALPRASLVEIDAIAVTKPK